MNQPKEEHESDGDSLGSTELFDAPKGPPPDKPLVAAALKAREKAEQIDQHEKMSSMADIASTNVLNKPLPLFEDADDSSLSDGEMDYLDDLLDLQDSGEPVDELRLEGLDLFEKWQNGDELNDSGKAKLQDFRSRRKKARGLKNEYLELMGRRDEGQEVDEVRLRNLDIFNRHQRGEPLTVDEQFELHTFEMEEGAKSQGSQGLVEIPDHLSSMHQPKEEHGSDANSLGSTDLFEPPKGPLPDKPLVAAALKAREKAEAQASPDYLAAMNQPKGEHGSDRESLESRDLFDAPKGPPPAKPLVAAALKARKLADASEKTTRKKTTDASSLSGGPSSSSSSSSRSSGTSSRSSSSKSSSTKSSRSLRKSMVANKVDFLAGSNIPTLESVKKGIEADENRLLESTGVGDASREDATNIWVPPALDFTATAVDSSSTADLDLSALSLGIGSKHGSSKSRSSASSSGANEKEESKSRETSGNWKSPLIVETPAKSVPDYGASKGKTDRRKTKKSEMTKEDGSFGASSKSSKSSRSSKTSTGKQETRKDIHSSKKKEGPAEFDNAAPDYSIASMLTKSNMSKRARAALEALSESKSSGTKSSTFGTDGAVDFESSEFPGVSLVSRREAEKLQKKQPSPDDSFEREVYNRVAHIPKISRRQEKDDQYLAGKEISTAYERLRSWDETPQYPEKPKQNVVDETESMSSRMRKSATSWAAPLQQFNPFSHIRRVAPYESASESRPDPPDENSSAPTGETIVYRDRPKIVYRDRPTTESRTTYYFDTADDTSVTSTWAPPSAWSPPVMKKIGRSQAPASGLPRRSKYGKSTSEIESSSSVTSSSSLSIWAPPDKLSQPPPPDRAALYAAWYRSKTPESPQDSTSDLSSKREPFESRNSASLWSSPVVQTVTTQAVPEYLNKPSIFDQMEQGKSEIGKTPFEDSAKSFGYGAPLDDVEEERSFSNEKEGDGKSTTTSSSDASLSVSKKSSPSSDSDASDSYSVDVEQGLFNNLPDFPPAAGDKSEFSDSESSDGHSVNSNDSSHDEISEDEDSSKSKQLATPSSMAQSQPESTLPDIEQGIRNDEKPKQEKRHFNWVSCSIMLLLLLLLVGGGAAAAVFLVDRGNDDEPSTTPPPPTRPPITAPTTQPTTLAEGVDAIIFESLEAVGGAEALTNPTSPQSEALTWIQGNENLASYSSTRVLQRYVMATVFYASVGSQWTNSDGWLTNEDECEWYTSQTENAVCNSNGLFDEFDLKANNVAGTIPWADLATLSDQLLVADFNSNSVSGSLPTQIGLLTNLVTLSMFTNQVTGTLPVELGGLAQLQYMDFDSNFLTGTLPVALSRMTRLETLMLSNNPITGTIPTEIGLLTGLKSFSVRNTFVNGTMPREICDLTSLETLEATCTDDFVCDCCTNVECGGSSSKSVRDLIVVNSPDGGASLEDPESPQSLALDWLVSPINSDYSSEERLIQRYALATLYFATAGDSWNSSFLWMTSGDECLWFTTSRSSTICDPEGRLVELDLQENNLLGTLPLEVTMLSESLQILRLPQNSLDGTIPSILHELSTLEHLDLSANALAGSLPSELGLFGNALTHLTVFDNSIGSTIPEDLGRLINLQVLDLGSNQLSGTIPAKIGLMRNLAGLSFFDNKLTGSVPCELQGLDRLELFYIDSNDLGPPICDEICELELLEFWSDCSEVQCACCTTCCDDEFGCVSE